MNKPARVMTNIFKFTADTFFAKRYGHRAVVLETVAAVPGMVAGMWTHLRSLRRMKPGYGPKIREMLAEAENERMHLMFFIAITKPSSIEKLIVVSAQLIFFIYYLFLYVFFRGTAHRMVAYFEEEAVSSYTNYLELIEQGAVENVPAPQIAIDYYEMKEDATLYDMIRHVRLDEMKHANVNHAYADKIFFKEVV
jgi:ubiquinol oxidase